jgi:amidohydrolase
VGSVGYTGEAVWAGSDRILIHVLGEQTHGAYPHLGVDPIVAASQLVSSLQTVASREVDTQEACVVSICQFHAGNQFNVLPEKVFLEGILRTHKDTVRERAAAAIRRICEGTAAATGTRIELELHRGALPTTNDPALLDRAVGVLRGKLGEERVRRIPAQMGAEDFASFSRAVPSVYMMLGIRNENEGLGVHPLHSPRFDVDEHCLQVGVEAAAALLAGLGEVESPATGDP